MSSNLNSYIVFIFKLLIVTAAFYYVVNNANFDSVLAYVKQANLSYLALALMVFIMMLFVMSLRLRAILAREGEKCSAMYLFKSFISGLFFNLALPGYVGGDGYVSYRLKMDKKLEVKKSIKALLNSRASGFFYICSAFYIFFMLSKFETLIPNAEVFVASIFALQILVYHLFAKYYFKESVTQFFQTSLYSITIQVLALLMILLILKSLNVENAIIEYFTLFYFGETVSIIPITPMGVGVREVIFYNAATQVGIYPEKAIAVSLTLFSVYVVTAIIGLIFYFQTKKLNTKE